MLEVGRVVHEVASAFAPPGRWLFVKIVVIAFCAAALFRAMPWRPRRLHNADKRPKRAIMGAWLAVLAGVGAAVCGSVLIGKSNADYTAYAREQYLAQYDRPAHATLAASAASYFGVYEPGTPSSYAPVAAFAAATHVQPRVTLYYNAWGAPFQLAFAKTAYAHNTITLVQFMPTNINMTSIARGRYDKYIRSYAAAVRTFRRPVIIGFGPEMNGNWYSWGYLNSPASAWVAAWRHVVDVFRANGAYNVSWLWTPNMVYSGSGPLASYWPGSNYVTWVGMDAYFVPQKHAFTDVIVPTLRAIRKITSDPVIIAETGIAPDAGKVATLKQLFAGVSKNGLLGFVYFDGNQPQGANYHYRWRLEDSPAAVAEYRRLAASYVRSP